MDVISIINNKEYTFGYLAEMEKFSTFLPAMQSIINSTKILDKDLRHITYKSGLPLSGSPGTLAVNPVTNKIYVAIPEANQIQVINGYTNQVIKNITIGSDPIQVVINSDTNKIYVATSEDIIYIIDGLTNR